MGSNSSMLLQREEIQLISNETGFSPKQIKRLYNRFTSLDKDNTGYLNKQDFLRFEHTNIE
jgi:calcineurin B family protein 1